MSSRDSSTKGRRSSTANAGLKGCRILVVEDSPVVGPFTADLLTELGCEVVGPAPTMAAARLLVDAGGFDAALMDVHIRGERVFTLCDKLASRNLPFILTSGYADWTMPERWRGCPRLQKPYTLDQVEAVLRQALKA